ncbi:hypothetical protein [Caldifermentibacillus hisashii]|uniref:hypothetical protein n=1 Tax=Caldifermentibacillus hisashii TaxID=996558 RepID=UPI0034D4A929
MVTRMSLVVKRGSFLQKNGDEIEARAKKDVFCLKMDIKGNPTRFIIEYNSSGIVPLKVYPALSLLNLTQPELCS